MCLFIEREVLVGTSPTWSELPFASILIQEFAIAVDVDGACREYTSTREDTYEMEDCRRVAFFVPSDCETTRPVAPGGGE